VGPEGKHSLVERARGEIDRRRWDEAYALLVQAADDGLDPDASAMLGRAAYLTGHPDVAMDAWERSHGARLKEGDNAGAAEAALHVCELLLDAGELSALGGWVKRAESLLNDRPEAAVNGGIAVVRGFAALIVGDIDATLAWGRRAAEIGARVDDSSSRVLGQNIEGRALICQGHVEEGLALIDETTIAAISGELDPLAATVVYCSAVCATQALADYDRAEEWTGAMERWCKRHSVGSFHGWCRVHGAEIRRLRGRLHEAEAEALRAIEEVRPYVRLERGWPVYEVGVTRLRMGDLAGAEQAFLEANELGWDPQPGLALLRLAQGDLRTAAASINDALDHPSQVQYWERPPNTDVRMAPLLEAQVEIGVAAADLERAGSASRELERIAATLGTKAFRAAAAVARGRILLAEADVAAAFGSFEDGVRLWKELGAPYETARARIGLASASKARGSDERALMELRAARSTFEHMGAKLDARMAAQAMHDIRPEDAARQRERRVFMFTDIVRSTDLVELIGDEAWGHLVRWHDATLASLVADHRGEVVRTMGDGFFVTFEGARDAVGCAVAIQRALRDHRRDHGFSPRVRIGLHEAEATREGQDWSGVEVHAAARIGEMAEGEEILVSRGTVEQAGNGFELSEPRSVSVKGIARPLEVVSVEWR
jgi:class 3 adenylate cyclase